MPAKSKAQQRLMAAAEHGASFPMAKKLRASMSHQQLHDFASGSEQGKPEHVQSGRALAGLPARAKLTPAPRPGGNRASNLGKFLHPKKSR